MFLWNKTPRFQKIHWFSCNSGQFLNACDNFLLQIGCDSFQISSAIECSSIQQFETQLLNITYFAHLQWINSTLMQNDRGFENYQLPKKFIFQQLVANFADIRRNNSIARQKKKKPFGKVWSLLSSPSYTYTNCFSLIGTKF